MTKKMTRRQVLRMINKATWGLEAGHNRWTIAGVEVENEMVRDIRNRGLVYQTNDWHIFRLTGEGKKAAGL